MFTHDKEYFLGLEIYAVLFSSCKLLLVLSCFFFFGTPDSPPGFQIAVLRSSWICFHFKRETYGGFTVRLSFEVKTDA